MFRTLFVWAIAAYSALAGTARIVPAAIITSFNLPSGPSIPVSTPVPNNDNTVTASPNEIDLPVAPGTALVYSNTNGISIDFPYQNSGGTTEYFFRETVLNNSGMNWSAFELLIQPNLVSTNSVPPNFDFTSDPTPTASAFSKLSNNNFAALTWSNGSVAAGATFDLTFSLDMLDLGSGASVSGFTLRQTPTAVPEPSMFLLAVAALASGLGWFGSHARDKTYFHKA